MEFYQISRMVCMIGTNRKWSLVKSEVFINYKNQSSRIATKV